MPQPGRPTAVRLLHGMSAHAYAHALQRPRAVRVRMDQQARGARDSETEQGARAVRGFAKAPCTGLPVCPALQRTLWLPGGVPRVIGGRAH